MSTSHAPSRAADASAFQFDALAWVRLIVLCSAILLEGMSLSSVSIQLTAIERDLGLSPDQLQLVASVFLTTYAGFLLLGGKCADHWGPRRTFLGGIAIFGIASLAASLATSALSLIVARAASGLGAAVTTPAAVALIAAEFPEGAPRNRALGVLSATGAGGFCLGVVVGGLLTDRLGWRWAFGLYIPLSALIFFLGPKVITTPHRYAKGTIPWVPAIVVTAGLIAIVYAAGLAGGAPLGEIAAVGLAGIGLVAAFLIAQARSNAPLLPPALLANRRMAGACVALGGAFAGITGAMFLIATAIQDRHGYSPLTAGLAFLPQGLAVGLLSTPAARLANRHSTTHLVLAGLGVITLGQLLYTRIETGDYLRDFLPATLLVGAGIAILYPAATIVAASSARAEEQGTASGVLTTCQQAGGALGVALAAGVQVRTAGRFGVQATGLWACFGFTVLSLLVCALLLRGSRDALK